jgi:hypothetical protein
MANKQHNLSRGERRFLMECDDKVQAERERDEHAKALVKNRLQDEYGVQCVREHGHYRVYLHRY